MDQPGKVANPACGQLNREKQYFPVCPRLRLRIWSRETRPSCPASACSFSKVRLNLVLTHGIPPDLRGGIMYILCMYGHHIYYSKCKDQQGKVANPARGQLNKENYVFPVPVRA